jgi:hypothetical protein
MLIIDCHARFARLFKNEPFKNAALNQKGASPWAPDRKSPIIRVRLGFIRGVPERNASRPDRDGQPS